MTDKVIENNQVTVMGEISSGFTYSHEIFGEGFYMMDVRCKRLSESYDTIPVMVSERLMDVTADYTGELICVNGQFRSYNRNEEGKSKLILSVFVKEIILLETGWPVDFACNNRVFLDGFICKAPIYRKTPKGREIADVILAVNRPHGKSDYIPCIVWGRDAWDVARLDVGAALRISGRIKSREYDKMLSETESETRVAYEVSAIEVGIG